MVWLPKLVGVSRPPIDARRFALSRAERTKQQAKAKRTTPKLQTNVHKCEECEEDLLPPCTCGDLIEIKQPQLRADLVAGSSFDEPDGDEEEFDEGPPPYAAIFRRHKMSLREIQNRVRRHLETIKQPNNPTSTQYRNQVLSKMAGRIDPQLQKITGYIKKGAKDDKTKNDWQFAARAIDRLCLYLFFGLIFTISAAFYYAAPHIVA